MKTLIAALALAATGVASAVPVTTFVASYGGSDYYTVTDDFDAAPSMGALLRVQVPP
jgi:hypothetical protein